MTYPAIQKMQNLVHRDQAIFVVVKSGEFLNQLLSDLLHFSFLLELILVGNVCALSVHKLVWVLGHRLFHTYTVACHTGGTHRVGEGHPSSECS